MAQCRFTGLPHRFASGLTILLAATLIAPGFARAANRHHITLGLGYSKLLSDDLKDDTLGIDFTNAGSGVLAYRYSLNPSVDLCLDSRGTISTDTAAGVDLTLTNSYFGPGVRFASAAGGRATLFAQANVLFASEEIELEAGGATVSSSESSVGFGLFGGVDMQVSKLLSIPIELTYLYAEPADDVSGFGFTVGLAFNFGEMK